jgi:hypothetical protein
LRVTGLCNAETIARLFREGPAKVTPGMKMPEQRVTDAEDLQALVEWLGRVTRRGESRSYHIAKVDVVEIALEFRA